MASSHESKARPGRSQSYLRKGTQREIFPVQDTRRRSSRVLSLGGVPNGTVRYRPQHPCVHACMPTHCLVLFYAILVLHYSVISSITARAHHPLQASNPNVVRNSTYMQADLLISSFSRGKPGRHVCMQAGRQSKASPLSSGTQVLGRCSVVDSLLVVVTRRCVRLRLRLASCVLRLCFPPYTAPLSYSPRACRLQVEVFVVRPSLLAPVGLCSFLAVHSCGLGRS